MGKSYRMACKGWVLVSLVVLGFAASFAVAQEPSNEPEQLIIGSKNFTENRLLGEIMAQLIESRTELEVVRRFNLGGTLVVFSALKNAEIDLYPEYTGTGWSIVLKEEKTISDPLRAYLHVAQEYKKRFGITWLMPFGFNNTYAVAIREDLAEELGISRISDLLDHDQTLQVGWSIEFMNREDGYPGLAAAYGLDFASVRGMEHGLAYEAIRSERIDLTDAYSTDGKLLRFKVKILEDDRRFFPPYDGAPIIRTAVLEKHPELEEILGELAFTLPDERMQKLNFEVEEKGRSIEDVASTYLTEEGLLDAAPTGDEARRGGTLIPFLISRLPETVELIGEHLALTAIAVLLAILLAVPLGIVLTRFEALAQPVLNATGVIQTIPSLALLAFMIPLIGLGAPSAIVALFLYALLPILRNTYTGIKEVDPELLEAARGMGLRDAQILRYVELPLATRTLMAGIRTSTVISIGVATLAAFIGAGGLGEPIVTGLTLNDTSLILSGAIPAALLAVVVDWALGGLETLLTPRGLR